LQHANSSSPAVTTSPLLSDANNENSRSIINNQVKVASRNPKTFSMEHLLE
jgi:hypothetical protein